MFNNTGNALKISSTDRIIRILSKLCKANVKLIIKPKLDQNKNISIRGMAAELINIQKNLGFRICDISERGIQNIIGSHLLQIEFLGLSTKVLFVTSLITVEQNSIIVSIPNEILSIERRTYSRYTTTNNFNCFASFEFWKPQKHNITSPPVFTGLETFAEYNYIIDISEGGFCFKTRFPAIMENMRRGLVDEKTKLILPLQPPIIVTTEIRWTKRIKERINIEGAERFQKIFKAGMQFVNLSNDNRRDIQHLIKQLSLADAM